MLSYEELQHSLERIKSEIKELKRQKKKAYTEACACQIDEASTSKAKDRANRLWQAAKAIDAALATKQVEYRQTRKDAGLSHANDEWA
jgi:YesN/AraC family two-component response regulator